MRCLGALVIPVIHYTLKIVEWTTVFALYLCYWFAFGMWYVAFRAGVSPLVPAAQKAMVCGSVVLLFLVGLIGLYLAPSTPQTPPSTDSRSTQDSSASTAPARMRLTVVEMHAETTQLGTQIVGTVRNASERPFNGYLNFNLYAADGTVIRTTLAGITQLPAGQTCAFKTLPFDSTGVVKYGVRDETDLTM